MKFPLRSQVTIRVDPRGYLSLVEAGNKIVECTVICHYPMPGREHYGLLIPDNLKLSTMRETLDRHIVDAWRASPSIKKYIPCQNIQAFYGKKYCWAEDGYVFPVQSNVATIKINSNQSGCICKKCNYPSAYAIPNQADGSFICTGCKLMNDFFG